MAALISIRLDKHILLYRFNYPVGAPLRRGAVRVMVICFFFWLKEEGWTLGISGEEG